MAIDPHLIEEFATGYILPRHPVLDVEGGHP
jgi:hypothetical protein